MIDRSDIPAVDSKLIEGSAPAYVKDGDLRFVAVNDAFLDLFGLERDAVLGHTASDVFGHDETSEERQLLVLGGRSSLTMDHGGQSHPFRLRREHRPSSTPVIVGIRQDTVQDASASKPSADDLTAIAHHMKTGVLLFDSSLRILAVNDMFYTVWGIERGALRVGGTFRDFIAASRRHRRHAMTDEDWRNHICSVESSIVLKQIPKREIQLQGGRAVFASGVVLSEGRTLLSFDDISLSGHSVQSIAALEETAATSDKLMRTVIDKLPAAVTVYGRDGKFLFDNLVRRNDLAVLDSVMREGQSLADADALLSKTKEQGEITLPDGRSFTITDQHLEDGTLIRLWVDIVEARKREERDEG